MPGFKKFKEIVDTEITEGAVQYSTWRKSPTQTTTIGIWFDLSMSPGNPAAQYYAASPLVATALARSTDGGLNHGGAVSPKKKFLRKATVLGTVATSLPMNMILLDYLLYYPFIDQSVTDPQVMDNTVTLPRYTDGEGVMIMAVAVAAQIGGQTFSVTYTNSRGESGRVTPNVIMTTAQSVNGTIINSARATNGASGPFLPLQDGDTGVRSIESVTVNGADVGLMSLVLVKPVAQLCLVGIDAPVEVDYLKDFSQMPEIKDDAYLNFICCPQGTLATQPLHGDILCIWK